MAKTDRESSSPTIGKRERRALVVGTGLAGLMASRALIDVGIAVSMCDTGRANSFPHCAEPGYELEVYVRSLRESAKGAEILEWKGIPRVYRNGSGFLAELGNGRREQFGCVFLTPDVAMIPSIRELPEGIELISPGSLPSPGDSCLFVLDYHTRTDPGVGMTAIKLALENVEAGGRSNVLMQHAPVAHMFGESQYERAKRAGVRFFRFGEKPPAIEQTSEGNGETGSFRVAVEDLIEGSELVAKCDRVFVAGSPAGSSVPEQARDIASRDIDEAGFLLSSSVHCHSGRSFTNGVFAVGEAVGSMDLIRIASQAASAAVQARAWIIRTESMEKSETVSFTEDCIRCLTCSRICPHAAFSYKGASARSLVSASAAACRECGVCVAECPRLVLDLVSFPDLGMVSFLEDVKKARGKKPVVVYGCQRSAGRAVSHSSLPNDTLFCSVPCAGRVSEALLWATLEAGASGILVAGCHHGNCASSTGTDWARARVESVVEKLGVTTGLTAPIGHVNVAANEGARFGRIVAEFCESLEMQSKGKAIGG